MEITTLQRRLETEQDLRQRAEAEVLAKNREITTAKLQDNEASRSKVAAITDQKEKLEIALKDWQTRHADLAARLDVSETQKSRATLEIEDLVCPCRYADYRIMNSRDLNKSGPQLRDLL
jgi:hypothetical protein